MINAIYDLLNFTTASTYLSYETDNHLIAEISSTQSILKI